MNPIHFYSLVERRNLGVIFEKKPLSKGFSHKTIHSKNWQTNFLSEALDKKIKFPYKITMFHKNILLEVAVDEFIYIFHINKTSLFPKTISLVIWWEICAPIFFLMIAALFMKNQVRPLQNLAQAVEFFGKGRETKDFKPAGSTEVRKVGRAFKAMQLRIKEQISHRMQMLSGISHDLKTPLTRMKLQIALLSDKEAANSLSIDVKDMENMVEEYLAFVRGQKTEQASAIILKGFIDDICNKFPKENIKRNLETFENINMHIRKHAMGRALKNIISNALRYGKNIWISGTITPKTVIIVFEDDGPWNSCK